MLKSEREEFLKDAEARIFSVGLDDIATRLCCENMKFGIAKILHIQKELGIKKDACFIATPDMTITRNVNRWKSGFGYGGLLSWGNGKQEIVILDVKPNACGMLVGGLDKLPAIDSIYTKIEEFKSSNGLIIDGLKVEWDFSKGNHFLNVYEVEMEFGIKLPKFIFILHGSGKELRRETKHGLGLYYDESSLLSLVAEEMHTPFGSLKVIQGQRAKEYVDFYEFAEEFSRKRRKKVAEFLFGSYDLISNETHQGLVGMNAVRFGCHKFIYPMTLKAELPAYLLSGKKNFSSDIMNELKFIWRAKENDLDIDLQQANLLPHGAGYCLLGTSRLIGVSDMGAERVFEIQSSHDGAIRPVSSMKELPYDYRGKEVLLRSLELDLCEIKAKLIPRIALKV